MSDKILDQLATDIDDASTVADELEIEPEGETRDDKLDELREALDGAKNKIDELEENDKWCSHVRPS